MAILAAAQARSSRVQSAHCRFLACHGKAHRLHIVMPVDPSPQNERDAASASLSAAGRGERHRFTEKSLLATERPSSEMSIL
jgi:hypothetical protein